MDTKRLYMNKAGTSHVVMVSINLNRIIYYDGSFIWWYQIFEWSAKGFLGMRFEKSCFEFKKIITDSA